MIKWDKFINLIRSLKSKFVQRVYSFQILMSMKFGVHYESTWLISGRGVFKADALAKIYFIIENTKNSTVGLELQGRIECWWNGWKIHVRFFILIFNSNRIKTRRFWWKFNCPFNWTHNFREYKKISKEVKPMPDTPNDRNFFENTRKYVSSKKNVYQYIQFTV